MKINLRNSITIKSRRPNLFTPLVIILLLPLALYLASQNQDLRQRAEGSQGAPFPCDRPNQIPIGGVNTSYTCIAESNGCIKTPYARYVNTTDQDGDGVADPKNPYDQPWCDNNCADPIIRCPDTPPPTNPPPTSAPTSPPSGEGCNCEYSDLASYTGHSECTSGQAVYWGSGSPCGFNQSCTKFLRCEGLDPIPTSPPQPTPLDCKPLYYCITSPSHNCISTNDKYDANQNLCGSKGTTCQQNLEKFLGGQTTGACYDSYDTCAANCKKTETPPPTSNSC